MEINKEKIRYILQYHYDKGKNTAQACEKICAIYDEDTLSKSAARKWFARFRAGNFDVKDEPRSGRSITEKSDEIMIKVEHDKHVSTVEIARELSIDHKTVLNYLHEAGQKEARCFLHELSVRNMMDRINICDTLLKRNEIEPFLKRIFLKRMITSDENWITYDNLIRKRSWIKKVEKTQAIAKPGLTRKKMILCVWDWKGIIHYELLSSNQTINSDLYCEQLQRLQQAIERKRPELINRRGVVFHHDNARPYTSLMNR